MNSLLLSDWFVVMSIMVQDSSHGSPVDATFPSKHTISSPKWSNIEDHIIIPRENFDLEESGKRNLEHIKVRCLYPIVRNWKTKQVSIGIISTLSGKGMLQYRGKKREREFALMTSCVYSLMKLKEAWKALIFSEIIIQNLLPINNYQRKILQMLIRIIYHSNRFDLDYLNLEISLCSPFPLFSLPAKDSRKC